MNKKTIITGFLTLILMGGNVLLATHGNDYSRELEGHESESDVEETKGEQAEDETAEQYRQRASQEAEAMRHDLEGDDTQASPFGSGLEDDTTEEDLIYVVPSPDPSYMAHEPLITPKGAFDMPRNNLAYVGLGSEIPALQDQQVETQQLSQEQLNYQLNEAALNGNLDSVKDLLERGVDIEATTVLEGCTPLIAAVCTGRLNIVEFLLNKKANIEAKSQLGITPLISAVWNGRLSIVKLLLKHKANIETANKSGETPLITAARMGHLEIVKLLLNNNADINAVDQNGITALIQAAKCGKLDTVKLLLKRGANIKAANKRNQTALIAAIHGGHSIIAELLLERGASIEPTAIDDSNLLIAAAYEGHTEIVRLLLDHGADIEAANLFSMTALMTAAFQGHSETVRLLLEREANIEATNPRNWTALTFAIERSHLGIIESLLNKGVQGLSVSKLLDFLTFQENNTLSFKKMTISSLSEIKTIITKVFNCDWNLESLLDIAIKNNTTASNFFKLIEIYYFINKKTITKNELQVSITYKLFESSVLENNIEILKSLFWVISQYDIDLNTTNEAGEGLLHIALRHGELEIIQVLLESGYAFDLGLVNAEDETPLGIALKNGHNEIVAYLANQNETQDTFLEVFGDTRLPAESFLQGDHPNPNAGEDEPPAKRRRVESGEEDEEDLNESIQDADAQDDQESIFTPSRTRKTRGLGKFDA